MNQSEDIDETEYANNIHHTVDPYNTYNTYNTYNRGHTLTSLEMWDGPMIQGVCAISELSGSSAWYLKGSCVGPSSHYISGETTIYGSSSAVVVL
jgi:hypothetical protein